MKKLKIFLFMCFAMIGYSPLVAQEVELVGEIEDEFLKLPLIGVKVSVFDEQNKVVVDSAGTYFFLTPTYQPDKVLYSAKVPGGNRKYRLRATRRGYTTVWKDVTLTDSLQGEVWQPVLRLRKEHDQRLGEAVVTATKIKMYHKGDTLVYNADAFKLPDGSRLDALIHQMPGVTMNEHGEIFVNGRKIDELLLGSRSFMRGNKKVLLENLPYYTVKNIKVYEQQSDRSQALGYDVDPRKYVMDVHLKNEYTRGYIANLEAAAGTRKRWMGRAFLLGFSDQWRYAVMANSNNVNETRHLGQMGYWSPALLPQSLVTTHSGAIDVDYQSKDKRMKNNLNASFTSTETEAEMRQRNELFLEGLRPLSTYHRQTNDKNKAVNVSNKWSYNHRFSLTSQTDFKFTKENGWAQSLYEQRDNQDFTVSRREHGFNHERNWIFNEQLWGSVNFNRAKQRYLNYSLLVFHDQREAWKADRFELQQSSSVSPSASHNTSDVSHHATTVHASASVVFDNLWKNTSLNLSDNLTWYKDYDRDYLYHPDTLASPSQLDLLQAITDRDNSYVSRRHKIRNSLDIGLRHKGRYKMSPKMPVDIVYDIWSLGVNLPYTHESLDYMRGAIDTVLDRSHFYADPYLSLRYVANHRRHDLTFNAKYSRRPVDLLHRVDFRDDRQPLVVKLGNPHLEDNLLTELRLGYTLRPNKYQQNLHAEAAFDFHHRDVAQSVRYNPTSGVYTYQPVNVKGSHRSALKVDYVRSLDQKNRWTWQLQTEANYHHALDHTMLSDATHSEVQAVNTTTLHGGTYVQYSQGAFNVRAVGNLKWHHSTGKMRDFTTLNAWDYQYGASARYTLPVIHTTLAVDAMMYSRRGYGSATFNTDDFVLNASLSQSFLKGKLIAKVEAFDVLHQLSNVQYAVNAQGRTETWTRSLPNYVMFHLAFQFNRSPKRL